jgi:surfeit locus 1 family protein
MVIRRLVPSARWAVLLVVVLGLAALFVRLGFWQLDRLEQRREFNAALERGQREPARPVAEVAPAGVGMAEVAYRRVTGTGTYLVEDEVVLYGRALLGEPGHHVLTPLLLDDGRALVVDRGWVPHELDTPPVGRAAPPAGEVTVTGVLFPPEEASAAPADDRLTRVDVQAIGLALDRPVVPAYLRPQSQEPPSTRPLPRPVPFPEPSDGPHLSYAIQWFAFAALVPVGYVALVRRESSPQPQPRVRERAGQELPGPM